MDENPSEASPVESALGIGFLTGFRERRRRGTRIALNWRYSLRLYLLVPLALMFGLFGGLDLLGKALWQRVLGLLLLVTTAAAAALLVRWLLRPVDAMSQQKLQQYYEEMRFGKIWDDVKGLYASWREDRRAS